MNEKIDWSYLFNDTRARIYLLWAALVAVGFASAHYSRSVNNVNIFWLVLSVLGLGYMYKVMPLRVKAAQAVLQTWFWTILSGVIVSFLAFKLPALAELSAYLGVFWLLLLAVAYLVNGLYDRPAAWYWVAMVLHIVAALACIVSNDFLRVQWLVAAIVSTWATLNLWIFRT